MADEQLRQLLVGAVPELPTPTDRIARVGGIVRRRRRQRMAAVAAAVACLALIVGFSFIPGNRHQGLPPAQPPSPAVSPGQAQQPEASRSASSPGRSGGGTSPAKPPGVSYDPARIPAGAAGAGTQRVSRTGAKGTPGDGIFRQVCAYSHMRPEDPTSSGASPLMMYAGGTPSGAGTCRGGTADRSAYFTAAVVDTRTGTPLAPREFDIHYEAYYPQNDAVRALPTGLELVATQASWGCWDGTDAAHDQPVACPAGVPLVVNYWFPRCWNGTGLNPSDVTYTPQNGRCSGAYPTPLPQISYHVLYDPPADGNLSGWRFANDPAGRPAKEAGYAGYVEAWVAEMRQTWTDNCVRRQASCRDGELGDGRVLT